MFDAADGWYPSGGLVQGTDGNLYGTTLYGGTNTSCYGTSCGTVFKITPSGTLTTLYYFCALGYPACTDGEWPAGLVQATNGDFYGTTALGGANQCQLNGYTNGCGTIFKITPSGTLTTLYSFCAQSACPDGQSPAGLIQSVNGDFYGTTLYGGTNTGNAGVTAGTVFKITPSGTLTTLYSFCAQSGCTDGEGPYGLVQGTDGNFYGTTTYGGTSGGPYGFGGGTVFKITPSGTLTTLYTFCAQSGCTDGGNPIARLVQATHGDLYGTTAGGGANGNYGTIFKITPSGTLTTLYSFCAQSACPDGQSPAGLIQATNGDFYGTTFGGGVNDAGTIFEMTPNGALTTLHSFCAQAFPLCPDGDQPDAGLVQATNGDFYGTTADGGIDGNGTIFSLSVGRGPSLPVINQSGVVSGASFQPGIASNSWITIEGTNLSPVTDTWATAIVDGNLPTSLDGFSVSVGGQPAYIEYVSPNQINAVAPNVGTGTVSVTVTSPISTSSAVTAVAQAAQPAFFQWG
jgi:uncharacterized repeat protein (TIGR03803 family)